VSALARTGSELGRAAREARAGWAPPATWAVAALAVVAVVPPLTGFPGPLDSLAGGLYLGLAAIGLGAVVGLAGIPSLAQGALVAAGVFASVLARTRLGLPLAPAAGLGALAGGALGLPVGALVAGLSPAVAAVATWLCSWVALLALQAFVSAGGLVVGQALPTAVHYELALALVALGALAFAALARSPAGVRLAAARDSRAAAEAAGVPVARLRVSVCGFAGLLAGLAGGLSVDLAGVADPSAYCPSLSLKLLLAVLIGGAARALGGPVGVALLGLVTLIGAHAASFSQELAVRTQTVLAAVVVLLLLPDDPEGLIPALERRLPSRRPRAPAAPPPTAAAAPAVRSAATLSARGLVKRYGAVTVLDALDLEVQPGVVSALIGPNGSGKTTALRALAGAVGLDAGTVTAEGRVVRTLQSPVAFAGLGVLESALVGAAAGARHSGIARTVLATPRQRAEAAALRAEALAALGFAGLAGRADTPAAELSVTEQRLLAIATALATRPRFVLLDEPTAGVGAAELPRLADAVLGLRDRGIGVLVVEHNLRFVQTVAARVTVLDAGRAIAAGSPAEVAQDPRVRAVYLGLR
jgi:branched-chain amino acid transport system ATP-binding protein/branched-chain amino acid transport system permease protein